MTDTDLPRPPKFRRRAADRPDEVLDAALALFARQGFARTTVEQVAAQAGLSKAAVYLYFPSKTALLQGLVHRAVASVADPALAQMAACRGDPRPLIAALLRGLAARLAEPAVAAVPGLILREAPHAPDIAALYRSEVLDRMIPALTKLIAEGVAGGHIRPVDPELTVRSVVGPVLVHLLLAQVFGVVPGGDASLERLVENHLTILNAGLEPEKGLP
jgi:AcrR family transcriptional regulator